MHSSPEAALSALALSDTSSPQLPPGNPTPSKSTNPTHNISHTSLGLHLDLTLTSAVEALVHHLTWPLSRHYSHQTILDLRKHLSQILIGEFVYTWKQSDRRYGSGHRSLICTKTLGLPKVLKAVAGQFDVDAEVWRKALAGPPRNEDELAREEWEAWCDPGVVSWRYGPWEYFDAEFDPIKVPKESIHTIWQAVPQSSPDSTAPTLTPARPSHAIPIRAPQPAPAVFAIPPTPANRDLRASIHPSISLLPSASISHAQATHPNHSRSSSAVFSARSPSPSSDSSDGHKRATTYPKTHGRGSGSNSSVSSSISDSNSGATQPLTPGSRPGSADPFMLHDDDSHNTKDGSDDREEKTPTPFTRGRDPSPATPREGTSTPGGTLASPSLTPTVTPYDNGNVTVLGGGVKLGGGGGAGSRPASVMAQHRRPLDRDRSPSISLASRALNTVLSPNGTAQPGGNGTRKTRTRRRIMPTYLGHLGQPGVGGPIPGAFGQYASGMTSPVPPSGQWGPPSSGAGVGVGVGVGPPPLGMMPRMGIPQRMPS